MKTKFSDLYRWDGVVGRGKYLLFGLVLFLVKFLVDRTISSYAFGVPWSIFNYENPGAALSQTEVRGDLLSLWVVSAPFLWVGVVLTLRRLRSAGLPLWLVVLFVVPMLKLVFFAILCCLPARDTANTTEPQSGNNSESGGVENPGRRLGDAVLGICITLLMTVPVTWLGTSVFVNYGWSLFLGLPFCMGFASALIFSFQRRRTLAGCILVALATAFCAGVALLMTRIEGVLCLIMAYPPAAIFAILGGVVAYAVQRGYRRKGDSPKVLCAAFLSVPLAMGVEHCQVSPAPLMKVKSAVIVNAPPEKVWQNVISFSELPPPREWMFLAGIAYPTHAEIHGHGPGAIRYCNFSTGPFVEPIEVWDEPNLLRFSVTANPAPMRELSPYHDLHPAHLDGFLVSREGQFHLVRLPGDKTLLEGTTWYQHHLWPAHYWQIWSDYIIHRIHLRVLNHVKSLSEGKAAAG